MGRYRHRSGITVDFLYCHFGWITGNTAAAARDFWRFSMRQIRFLEYECIHCKVALMIH